MIFKNSKNQIGKLCVINSESRERAAMIETFNYGLLPIVI